MGLLWKTSLTLLSVAVIVKLTFGYDKICLSVHKSLNRLYLDGVKYTGKPLLSSSRNNHNCGCIEIPSNTGVIAIEATNYGGFSGTAGLQMCDTAAPALFDSRGWLCDWKLGPAEVNNWYKPNFDDRVWHPSRRFHRYKSCLKKKQNSCRVLGYFWTHKFIRRRIYCRLKLCADNCVSCKLSGPGKCDQDKCKTGSEPSASDPNVFECKRKCCIDLKTTNDTSAPDGFGYIKVTDKTTGSIDTWQATASGRYAALLDIGTCKLTNKTYETPENEANVTHWINRLRDANNLANENQLAFDIAIGDIVGSQLVNIWRLGIGDAPLSNPWNDFYSQVSMCVSGVPYGNVTYDSFTSVPVP